METHEADNIYKYLKRGFILSGSAVQYLNILLRVGMEELLSE